MLASIASAAVAALAAAAVALALYLDARRRRRHLLITIDDTTVGWVENGAWVVIDHDVHRWIAADNVRQMAADVRADVGLPPLEVSTDQMLAGWTSTSSVTRPGVPR